MAYPEQWQEEKLFYGGDEFYRDLHAAIDSACETIDLESYIFHQDSIGQRVTEALIRASRRGVRVRLLLDGFGCARLSLASVGPLLRAGVKVRFFHPLPWQHPRGWRFWRYLTLRRLILGFSKLNRRNHRKSCVIDGKLAYVGGMNISGSQAETHAGRAAWRDTSARVRGPGVERLSEAFDYAWQHPRGLVRRWKRYRGLDTGAAAGLVRLNVTRRQRKQVYDDLVRRVLAARSRVWITNPYFVPEISLVAALRQAALSGADVRLMLPRTTDVPGMRWAIRTYYGLLLSAGIAVFEYRPRMLHAKSIVVDDWSCVGSTNLNHRSFFRDLEVDVVLGSGESRESLRKRFEADCRSAKRIRPSAWRSRPLLERALERAALCFRRWY